MMYTTQFDEAKTRFIHNGDYSGNMTIVEVGPNDETVNMVDVPIADIEAFMATKKQMELITLIENLDLRTDKDRTLLDAIYTSMQRHI